MSTNAVRSTEPGVARVDLKLEAVVIPVSDVDRAKEFYAKLGWRLDADFRFENGFRVVQFTPPGSECSVQFGANITSAQPGSAQGLYLVVSDFEAARGEPAARGVEVSEVFHAGAPGAQFQSGGRAVASQDQQTDHATYGSFATFSDSDGNGWLLQEVTTRLPGRIDTGVTSFGSASDLATKRCAVRQLRTASRRAYRRRRSRAWPRLVCRVHGGRSSPARTWGEMSDPDAI